MPRKNATLNVDVLGKPDVIPEERIGDYIESQQSNDFFIKAPVWDSIGDGLEEFYLAARMEHHAMMREKAVLMEHQEMQSRANANHFNQLKKSQDQLQNRFVEVNVFLREFEEKRNVAVKKGTRELELHAEIRGHSLDTRKVLDELGEFRNAFQATANEYEPYERVLNDVVRKTPVVNNVKDLMDRCDSLMLAQVEIVELNDEKVSQLEIMRKRLVAIAREAALQVLGLKNALTNVDRFYEAARNEVLKWERSMQLVQRTVNEGICEKDRVMDGLNHIYRLLCQRRSVYPEFAYDEIEKRLDFIKDEVELLQDVLEVCQKDESKSGGEKRELLC